MLLTECFPSAGSLVLGEFRELLVEGLGPGGPAVLFSNELKHCGKATPGSSRGTYVMVFSRLSKRYGAFCIIWELLKIRAT